MLSKNDPDINLARETRRTATNRKGYKACNSTLYGQKFVRHKKQEACNLSLYGM